MNDFQNKWLTNLDYLWILILVVTALMFIKSSITSADMLTGSGNISVSGRVAGPPPSQPAIIQSPINGQHFNSAAISVSGTCPTSSPIIVEIYKNDIFAGSTDCQSNGNFSLQISLSPSQNDLIAKVRDNLDQYGPDSPMVSVYLDVINSVSPSSNIPGSTSNTTVNQTGNSGNNLQIIVDPVFRGTFAGDPFNLNFGIKGGKQPFAVSINWGDGTNQDLMALPDSGFNNAKHIYKNAGIYKIVITVVDSRDDSNFIQTLTIINQKTPYKTAIIPPQTKNRSWLDRYWYYLASSIVIIMLLSVSFWLGEKHEQHEIKTIDEINPPQ